MEIEQFAAITRRVIASDGFDEYLPTACYPARQQVVVLEGVPATVDIEAVAVAWASKNAEAGEEYIVAFKVAPQQFKVVRREGDNSEEKVFTVECA